MSKARSPCTVCSTTIGINGLLIAALDSVLSGVGMERDPLKPRQKRSTRGASHQGGDRLRGVDVVFEVASRPYPLGERAATLMAESLRVKAAQEPCVEGTVGDRAVADAIELRLIEDTIDPITLGGDEAEAVYYALDAPTDGQRPAVGALRRRQAAGRRAATSEELRTACPSSREPWQAPRDR